MKKCLTCGEKLLENSIRCPYCGAVQEETNRKKCEDKQRQQSQSTEGASCESERTERARAEDFPGYCSECGMKLDSRYQYCPGCGRKTGRKNKSTVQVFSELEEKTGQAAERIAQNLKSGEIQYAKGLLKISGILFCILYIYSALRYLTYLNYYSTFDKVWGLCMTVTCTWNAGMLFLISFRCQKEYGRNLLYSLFCGSTLKCVLHVIKIQDTAKYYQVGIADYYPVAGAVLIAAVCYYLMKKENQIEEEEKEPFGKVMRDTPGILRQIFIQDFSEKKENTGERKRIEKKAEKVQIREDASLNQWQSFILQLGTSSVFLLFCLLYTGDLVYKLFSELSFIKWVMELLPILLCVALWKIYFGSKNGKPDESGFSIARGVMTAEYVIQILVSVPVCMVGTVFGGPVGLILALAVSLVDICYIGSLRKTTLCTEKIIKGDGESVTVSFYPVLVLGFNVMIKTVGFLWAAFWQSAANAVTNSMYGYGDEASSLMAGFFSSLGIDYGYSYGQSSSFIQSLLSPVEAWIQSKFGFNENPLVMLLAIAIPVCEIILLRRVRSFKGVITGVDERQDLKG